ncbi:MAG: fumarylacetoacetate hydrolase family protein [Gammaproteobacteria bacterium]|nr:fumarylacetoacetate hydrolase family protein [Gammaproteobacteria bacterium]
MQQPTSAHEILLDAWRHHRTIDVLPDAVRPTDIAAGYALQDAVIETLGEPVSGYKIAATSAAGQAHIAIDHPISGQLRESRVLSPGTPAPMAGNTMRVAEAEFVFEFGVEVVPRDMPYTVDEAMAFTSHLRLGIELPNARYRDFVNAGAAQLIADNACAYAFVLGPRVAQPWRDVNLAAHPVKTLVNGEVASRGVGGDALGDPREALTWFVNHYSQRGRQIAAGSFVTTGVCGEPASILPGQHVDVNFGSFGELSVDLRSD